MTTRLPAVVVLLVAITACDRPPQWVLWIYRNGWHAQSEHRTLAACQEAAEENLSTLYVPGTFYGPKCLSKGVKP